MKEQKAKKSRGLGCLARLVILVLILVVAAYVAAAIFFPADRIKAEIEKRASETLRRHVELDAVSLSILPRLTLDLKGLRVYNPEDFPGGELVSIDRLSCRLKLFPLLKKQLVFNEITVHHPVLNIRKTKDGKVNYDFEIEAGEEGVQTPLGKKEKLTSEEAAMSAFAYDWAEIRNADLIYIDDSSDIQVTLNNFNLSTRLNLEQDGYTGHSKGTLEIPSIKSNLLPANIPLDIAVAYNADVDFRHADLVLKKTSLEVNGIAFEVESTVRNFLDLQSIFAKIHADGVELEPLLEYLPPSEQFDRGKLRLSGKIEGDVEARLEFGSNRKPYFAGAFDLKDLTVGYINIANRVNFENLHLAFDADTAAFSSRGGQMSEKQFGISGVVKNWDDPVFALKTNGSYSLVGALPFLDPVYNHDLSGLLNFDLQITGKKSKWIDADIYGTVGVDKLYYTNDSLASPLNRLDMKATFKGQSVTIDSLYAEYPGIKAYVTGSLKNGFAHLLEPDKGHKKPYLDFNMYAPLINYDTLFPVEDAAVASTGQAGSTTSAVSGEAAAPIFIPDIEAGGKVTIDKLIASKVEFTNIKADAKYDNGIISYKNASASLYSGSITSEGQIDLTNFLDPALAISYDCQNIEANDFMTDFANLGGHLFGKMNLKGNLTGRGSEPEQFLRSLNADGDVLMQDGKIVNFELIEKLAEQFKFKTFEEQDIKNLVTAAKIRDGKLVLDGTKLIDRIGNWDVGGTVDLLDQKLDLDIGLYLNEDYSKKFDFMGGLLLDKNNRVRVNFDLTGDYKNPTISNLSTDNDAVKDNVTDKLKEGVNNLLNQFKKKK